MTTVYDTPHFGDQLHPPTHSALPDPFRHLVDRALATALPPNKLGLAVAGGVDAISWIGRSICVQEGTLIEASIAEAARRESRHLVLTGLKLPVLQEAINLVTRHHRDQVCDLSVDADAKAVQSYFPDLVIVDQSNRSGIVIDIKRSLVGYGGSGKLAELQLKMAASALALPDVLWRDHKRTYVDRIGTAIIDASREDNDIDAGLWSLAGLDQPLGCSGAGGIAKLTVEVFRHRVQTAWRTAIASTTLESGSLGPQSVDSANVKPRRGRPPKVLSRPTSVSLFRPGEHPIH